MPKGIDPGEENNFAFTPIDTVRKKFDQHQAQGRLCTEKAERTVQTIEILTNRQSSTRNIFSRLIYGIRIGHQKNVLRGQAKRLKKLTAKIAKSDEPNLRLYNQLTAEDQTKMEARLQDSSAHQEWYNGLDTEKKAVLENYVNFQANTQKVQRLYQQFITS